MLSQRSNFIQSSIRLYTQPMFACADLGTTGYDHAPVSGIKANDYANVPEWKEGKRIYRRT